jgi:hypothetical protein
MRNAGLGQYARSDGWMRETTGHAFYQRVVLMIKVLRILRHGPPFPNLPFPRSSPCAVPLHPILSHLTAYVHPQGSLLHQKARCDTRQEKRHQFPLVLLILAIFW